ncbi:T9SS type A sorting domain-containing protein [Fulvivirga ligni]|uniref:T9SS type A sorting domain-containing protein n=1 Tax=Fulvivirga ligni TaxID=2904246 RepID=UPI001F26A9DB|nr:T9SS type A sorting domain-containing protein [Fulvivirga ligni]UII23783.1 T9SS type A sorting domain-containing protein [Fulvivirga ligni]
MKKSILLSVLLLFAVISSYGQIINVTGGPGRVNNNTVIKGQPFTATVTGLNGTPQKWSVGIGTINGQLIYSTSSTTVSNAIVDRTLTGNTALISVGATNGRGVARYLTVQDPPTPCLSQVRFLSAEDCSIVAAILTPVPDGATGYSWTVTPSIPFTNYGNYIQLRNLNPFSTYNVSITVTGGTCNGATFRGTYRTGDCNGFEEPFGQEDEMTLFPNPVDNKQLNVLLNPNSGKYQIEVMDESGNILKGIPMSSEDNIATFDLQSLKSGTYYLKYISGSGKEEVKRFVLE